MASSGSSWWRSPTATGAGVALRAIQDAIGAIVDRGTVEQLVVYYAGHGINNGQSEYWLLSDAFSYASEAVNVAGSALLAERCGIPHVVIVSDACRTAPAGIKAAGITGGPIFPTEAPAGDAASVDQFFACKLADVANEIADVTESGRVVRSIYTYVLVEALEGRHLRILAPADEPGTPIERPVERRRRTFADAAASADGSSWRKRGWGRIRHQVDVCRQGEGGRVVAEHHLDLFGVPAGPKEDRGARVPERVHSDPRHPCAHPGRLDDRAQDELGPQRSSFRAREDRLVAAGARAMEPEILREAARQWHLADAVPTFGASTSPR